ncbi:hypothetical protein [Halorubrum laminariae]|uniref:Glycosyltransferase RgtA/B/C/D-like domain-containing protein n=1 Tax=Halorubrum laminariae TaxID=1433523 RepID=A0ABD6C3B9_9EURY|nr:hypothetical protein [Halorubrum laminariae]
MSASVGRLYFLVSATILSLFSATYYIVSIKHDLFPYTSALTLLISTVLLSLIFLDLGPEKPRSVYIWAASVCLGFFNILVTYDHTGSIIGIDPDVYALWAYQTSITTDPSISGSSFYSDAPLFHTFISLIQMILGTSMTTTMMVLSLCLLAFYVTFTHRFTLQYTNSYDSAAVGAVLAATLAILVKRSFWPIAQSFGIIFFLLFAYIAFFGLSKPKYEFPISIGLLAGMAFAHKLLPVATLLILGPIFISDKLTSYNDYRESGERALVVVYSIFVLLFTLIQWTYITTLVETVVRDLTFIFTLGKGGEMVMIPTSVIVPDAGALEVFGHQTNMLVMLLISGLAWVWLAYYRRNRSITLLIVTVLFASLTGMFGMLTISTSLINYPLRVYFLSAIFLISIVSYAAVTAIRLNSIPIKTVACSLLLVLLVFQVFSAAAIADFPGQFDPYLSDSEAEGKFFVETHFDGDVHTDTLYAHKIVDFERYTGGLQASNSEVIYGGSGPNYVIYDECLFNQTSCDVDDGLIMYRSGNDIYRTWGTWKGSEYRLQWDPSGKFAAGENVVYDSENVEIYGE